MRDPVGYRCNDTAHWRTGIKYKASPVTALPVLSGRSVIDESSHSCANDGHRAQQGAPALQLHNMLVVSNLSLSCRLCICAPSFQRLPWSFMSCRVMQDNILFEGLFF